MAALTARRAEERQRSGGPDEKRGNRQPSRGGATGRMPTRTSADRSPATRSQQLGVRP